MIFDSKIKIENSELENIIKNAINSKFGFEVPVIVRSPKEIATIIKKNPFYDKNTNIEQLHLTFLDIEPQEKNLKMIEIYNFEPDKYKIEGKEVFIYCQEKYHTSKLTNNFIENKLGVNATTRNWKTVLKVQELTLEND